MGLAIASVYILLKRKRYGIDKVVSSPFAISVFKTLKIFFVARCEIIAQISCLKCRYKEIRQKIGYLRVETKSRSVGIVIKKWSFKQETEIRLCIA